MCVFMSRQQESGCGYPGGSPHRAGSSSDHLRQEENPDWPLVHQQKGSNGEAQVIIQSFINMLSAVAKMFKLRVGMFSKLISRLPRQPGKVWNMV